MNNNFKLSNVESVKSNSVSGIIKNNEMLFTFGIDNNTVTLLADEVRVYDGKIVEVYKEGNKIFESPYSQLIIKDEGKEIVMIND